MKTKTAVCSTGHGTGVQHMIELGLWLQRERSRLKAKQYARRQKRYARTMRSVPVVEPVRHAPVAPAPVKAVGKWQAIKSALSRLLPRRMA